MSAKTVIDLGALHRHRYVLYVICPVTTAVIDQMMAAKTEVVKAMETGNFDASEEYSFAVGEPMAMRGPACVKCNTYWVECVDTPCPVGDNEFMDGIDTPGRVGEKWATELRPDEQ